VSKLTRRTQTTPLNATDADAAACDTSIRSQQPARPQAQAFKRKTLTRLNQGCKKCFFKDFLGYF